MVHNEQFNQLFSSDPRNSPIQKMEIWAKRYLETEQDYFDKEYQERSRI